MAQVKHFEKVNINELVLYENNSKKHPTSQIQLLKDSINEFGFLTPILIDENNNVIAGHGRIEASKELGIESVPCVRVEGLTDNQRKAYIIADNRLSELGGWDKDLVASELSILEMDDFNIDLTGFDIDDFNVLQLDDIPKEYGSERQRTLNAINLHDYDSERSYKPYDIPLLKACDVVPNDMIGFNYVMSCKKEEDFENGVHFFIDDYQFERIWNNPQKYINKLKKFKCVCTPDFSPYADMPTAMKIWNVYRNRLVGQIMQDAGINVIPTITWSDESTFDYVIDGIQEGGTVAISTVSISKLKKHDEYRKLFYKGIDLVVERIKPKTILLYGQKEIDLNVEGVEIVRIRPHTWKGED